MFKKKTGKSAYFEKKQGISSIQNQINESYQIEVIEDRLENNKEIYTLMNFIIPVLGHSSSTYS